MEGQFLFSKSAWASIVHSKLAWATRRDRISKNSKQTNQQVSKPQRIFFSNGKNQLSIFSLSFIYKSGVDSIEKQPTFLWKYVVQKYDVFPSEWQMSKVIGRLSAIGKYVLCRYIQIPYSMQICRIMHQLKQKKLKIRIVN